MKSAEELSLEITEAISALIDLDDSNVTEENVYFVVLEVISKEMEKVKKP